MTRSHRELLDQSRTHIMFGRFYCAEHSKYVINAYILVQMTFHILLSTFVMFCRMFCSECIEQRYGSTLTKEERSKL